MSVHHLLHRFAPRDPRSALAVEMRQSLRRLGLDGDLFALSRAFGYGKLARPWSALPNHPDDVCLCYDATSLQWARRSGRAHVRNARDLDTKQISNLAEALQPGLHSNTPTVERPRVAIVVQRYGPGLGGAEAHARAVAARLGEEADVTVLSTCAEDHLTWANAHAPGIALDGKVRVHRFPVTSPRAMWRSNLVARASFGRQLSLSEGERWLAEQGPLVPELLRHLSSSRGLYDAYVFFTYLYTPTAWGLPLVADKALVVPTAHDEPPFDFDIYRDVFVRPRALLCNTEEEVETIRRRHPEHARTRVVGVGLDAPQIPPRPLRFRETFQIQNSFLLYVGRMESGKGIPELLAFHREWVLAERSAPELVLAGPPGLKVSGPKVRYLGFLSEEQKQDAVAAAEAVVIPSRHESLSLITLEALAAGTPIVVHGASPVLAGHVKRSGAGVTYLDAPSFRTAVQSAMRSRLEWAPGAKAYAEQYQWSRVMTIYREEIRAICDYP